MAARRTFNVDPDTHIDSLEQAEQITIEGTSKWSCKIAITGLQRSFAAPNRTLANLTLLEMTSPLLSLYHFLIFAKNVLINLNTSIIILLPSQAF